MKSFCFCSIVILLSVGCTSAVLYFPQSCASQCSAGDFIPKLPVENGPVESADNRAYAWATIAMIQTKLNFDIISPPASARITAIVGTCLYEAAAITEQNLNSYIKRSFKLRGELPPGIKDAVMDGAGYWAVRRLFGDTSSFGRVAQQYQNFAGLSIQELVPALQSAVRAVPTVLGRESRTTPMTRVIAARLGAVVCDRVVKRFTRDGFSPRGAPRRRDPTRYRPVNRPQRLAGITDCDNQITDLSRWQPLCIPNTLGGFGTPDCTPQSFLYPWAGRFTTFALQGGNENTGARLINPPPQPGSPAFRQQAAEVLTISGNLGDAQKVIAEYWADGPDTTLPAGHLWKVAADAARTEGLSTAQTARLLFIVGNALNDAGVASWRTKTSYDFVRPLQMIQCGEFRGQERRAWRGPYQGVGPVNVSQWRPYQATRFVTPPFAAYTSGHSTFSAAAAEALRLFFGDDRYRGPRCDRIGEGQSLFEPRSNAQPGFTDIPNTGPDTIGYVPREDVVLCWSTFTAASDQSGQSRLFGGIHIKADDTAGQALGRRVGRSVFDKASSLTAASQSFG